MDQKKFEAILTLLVPKMIDLIVKNYGLDEISATRHFTNPSYTLFWRKDSRKLGIFSMQFERATYPMLFYTWIDTI